MTQGGQEPLGTPPLWEDPVIEEVRTIRRRLWDAAGRDVRRFLERTRQADERRRTGQPAEPGRPSRDRGVE